MSIEFCGRHGNYFMNSCWDCMVEVNLPCNEVTFGPPERQVKLRLPAAADPVNAPAHYAELSPEPIDVIEGWDLGFCLGNAVKYISRAGRKDPAKEVEDLKKARWYIDREIAALEGES